MITAAYIESSLQNALAGKSKLTPEVLAVRGFSTPTMRHLFNNLGAQAERYLEVGIWHGGTATAALFENRHLRSTLVDDISQDFNYGNGWIGGQVLASLENNLELVRPHSGDFQFINQDCWTLDKSKINDVDIYFFDGKHDLEDQSKALPHFFDCLADQFVFIVDDSTWEPVRKGTYAGFEALQEQVEIKQQWLMHPPHGDHPVWHNGVDIYLCQKIK